jgi:MFS superfamily sulfate permease-like transporter
VTDNPSPLAPRPRPGFKSRPERPERSSAAEVAAFVANTMRALLGVLCLGVAVLWLPPHMVTPILSGVSVLMIVSGSYGTWQVARRQPRFAPFARVIYWGAPALGVVVFALVLVLGAGGLGPTWSELAGQAEPATFLPGEEAL